jgi:hypothetical protein
LSKTFKCKQLDKACTDAKYIVGKFKFKKRFNFVLFQKIKIKISSRISKHLSMITPSGRKVTRRREERE